MRRAIGCFVAVAFLAAAPLFGAGSGKQPAYVSNKPLFAQILLNEKGTALLTLAFDESEGTGKGYDTMYADLNLNGDLTDNAAIKGTLQSHSRWLRVSSFPPMAPRVPYNDKAKDVQKPWEIMVSCTEYTEMKLFGLIRGRTFRTTSTGARMQLKDESGEWEYSFSGAMQLSENLASTSPIAFRGKPMLQVETKRDPEKKGNTGIAVYLRLGEQMFRCFRGGKPIKASILVKDGQAKTVHSEDVSHEKLFFG